MVTSHIGLRGRVYRLRIRIPSRLRERVGRREIARSLMTGDRNLARLRGTRLASSLHQYLNHIQAHPDMPRVEIVALVNRWLQEQLDDDLEARPQPHENIQAEARRRRMPVSLHHSDVIAGSAQNDLDAMTKVWSEQDWDAVQRLVAPDIAGLGVVNERGTAPFIKMAEAMFTAMARLKEAQIARSAGETINRIDLDLSKFVDETVDVGDGDGEPRPPASEPAVPLVQPELQLDHVTLAAAREQYMAQIRARGGLGIKAVATHNTVTALLEEVLGGHVQMSAVSPSQLGNWKQIVLALPQRRNKVAPGLAYADAIALAKEKALPKIDNSTVKSKYVVPMKQFFRWAKETGLITSDPSAGINHRVPKRQGKKRNPFNDDELRVIFGSALYTGCKSSSRITTPGTFQVRDHRFWMPLVALYTGARLGEICQLELKDVVLRDSIWCFDINDERGKSVKTEASKRLTPIHSGIIKLGFLDYVEERRAAGGSALWPDVRKSAAGIPSDLESKRLNRLLDLILGEEYRRDRLLCFHSFRHTMIDAMRTAGISPDVRHAIVGHEGEHVEQKHYGEGYKPKALATAVEKVSYPIDLSALYVAS